VFRCSCKYRENTNENAVLPDWKLNRSRATAGGVAVFDKMPEPPFLTQLQLRNVKY
jgi:hypothetical protein